VSAFDEPLAPGRAPHHLRTHAGADPADAEAYQRLLKKHQAVHRVVPLVVRGAVRSRSWHTDDPPPEPPLGPGFYDPNRR
jgi:hypothetical protein